MDDGRNNSWRLFSSEDLIQGKVGVEPTRKRGRPRIEVAKEVLERRRLSKQRINARRSKREAPWRKRGRPKGLINENFLELWRLSGPSINPCQAKKNVAEATDTDHTQAPLSTSSPCSRTTSSPVHDMKEMVGKDPIASIKATLHPLFQSKKEATTSVYSKRRKSVPPTIIAGRREETKEATEVNPPKKKMEESIVKPQTGLLDVDPVMPPGFSRDGVLVVDLPSSPEEEKPKCDLPLVLEQSLEPDSLDEDIQQDRQHLVKQHLVNTVSVLKSQLVTCLTSSADKLSPNDMIDLANRSYNELRAFGDDYTSFNIEVNKLIARRQKLEYAAKKREKNDQDLKARYVQQKRSLSDMENKFVIAQEKLFRAESNVESLKLKREEITGALARLTEELSEEEKKIQTLAAERDHCEESYSGAEAELRKLDAEKDEARVAFEVIKDQYNAAKDEFERMNSQLLELVRK